MSLDSYFNSDEFRELLADYEDALEKGMPVFLDADELVDIADYYEMQGRSDDADLAIDRALELNPTASGALAFKVGDALDKGDPARARYYMEQMTDQQDEDYVFCQAEMLMYYDRDEEADDLLKQHLESEAVENQEDYMLDVVNLYTELDRAALGMQWIERISQRDDEDYLELKGRCLYGVGRFTECEEIYKRLTDINPFEHNYWIGLAASQLMLGHDGDALESSEYAIAINPESPDAVIDKANALYRMMRYDEARDYFHRYSEMEPDDVSGPLNEAMCLVAMERYEQGAKILEEITPQIDDQAMLADAYQELAFAYGELGRPNDAIATLELTDNLPCDHTRLSVVKGHMMLAAGRLVEAEEVFLKAVEQSDEPVQTLLQIIVSLYDNGLLTTAYKMFQRYFKLKDPDCHDGYAYMALCCHDMGRKEEYHKWLQLACQYNPDEARQALAHLFPEGMSPEHYYDNINISK